MAKHNCPMCGEQWNEDVCGSCGWFEGKQPRYSEPRHQNLPKPTNDETRLEGAQGKPESACARASSDGPAGALRATTSVSGLGKDVWFIRDPKDQYWWREDRCGYTSHIYDAGFYTEKEAKQIETCKRGDKAVPITDKYVQQDIATVLAFVDRLQAVRGEA
jgi:hypothetical protein